MDYELISQTALFQGCSPSETEKLLHGLKTFTKKYKKGAPVYLAGTPVTDIGIVLYGTVQIENNDLWGNKNIISLAHTGEVFAEAYACVPGEPMMVSVVAAQLFAYYCSVQRGLDPDKPRNLAKSVTVE